MDTNTELMEQTISAALDGEPVDVESLRRALATPAGRDALAAFVLLRSAVTANEAVPLAQVPADAVSGLARPQRRGFRALSGFRVPAAVAASIAGLAVAGSFWLGTTWQISRVGAQLPPTPSPAINATVVPVAGSPEVSVAPTAAPCPPAVDAGPPRPTRVLRYVRGVDWRDGN